MKPVETYLVNSFVLDGSGGNPAGVVLNAELLSEAEKLHIAQAVGFSETAFVIRDEEVDFELTFYTTTEEVDFCGHATLAAFSVMFEQGIINVGKYVQRTKAGILEVYIEGNGKVVMQQRLPEFLGSFSYQAVSPLIGVDTEVLAAAKLPIEVVSTGLADMIVPVPMGYLDKVKLNEDLMSAFCKQHNLVGAHVFELSDSKSNYTASCRNFAPLFGIPEESATGSASGALACYLTKHTNTDSDTTIDFLFEQGRAMKCASEISASIQFNGGQVSEVKVGGFAQVFDKESILLEL
ncbi:phenazine biosynthesis protein PhzF [Pseudoalteromonas luteoviolacea]|uniref:Phenazine biosynthesis protein PhzF n=1 Tax=Pseudoalteromonas luteoviolacea TaxID=43657 RepID=A0A0C1QQ01_9GAMM|nr:PhzF family phenazine biosynthesis protein [Pseudoalteromonas luteoviolacea]KID57132.1 phenazine biosynthesis protein PhzF [Pseudoalteromonas luteoviolacea]